MNLSISSAPRRDLTDYVALAMVTFTVVSAWVYTFMHPSVPVFCACVGASATEYAAYHWIVVRDSKVPDAS